MTIVIPVYNGANHLDEAIRSAISQTYRNLEIIVVNDGSNDDGKTERIAQSYATAIRYFVKTNGGVASALNLAISKMSGDYFSWLSHDDLYCEEKIAVQVKALYENGPDKMIVYSDYSTFIENPAEMTQIKMQGVPPERFRYWLTTQASLHGCSLLIPRSALGEFGGFNETLRTTQDYDLWFRLAEKYRFKHIPKVLVKSRCHPNQGTVTESRLARKEAGELFKRFVNALTVEEITLATGQAIGCSYLIMASCMWRRGFRQAGNCAGHLARQYGISPTRIFLTMLVARAKNIVVEAYRACRLHSSKYSWSSKINQAYQKRGNRNK